LRKSAKALRTLRQDSPAVRCRAPWTQRLRDAYRQRSTRADFRALHRRALIGGVLAVLMGLVTVIPTPAGAANPPAASLPVAGRVGASCTPRRCTPNLADGLRSTQGAGQLITVEAANFATTVASFELWQRHGACWARADGPWAALVGENGFSNHHREGDGTTPTGTYRIGPVVYGNAPNPGFRGQYRRIVCGDWWDEDPTSPAYNTFQYVPCGQSPPFGGDSEALWTETAAYPSFAVVEYNTSRVVPYAGSAIFVHASTGVPTVGCVSIPLSELNIFLRWLDPAQVPMIVMGPASEMDRF
jgi:L,D-peptidoglycan transpeptidase YkuD (ErfK/YbiS/YcfS/YnhG family)